MLKLGCILPDLANIWLQNSPYALFYSFTEADEDLLENFRQDVAGGILLFLHAKRSLMKI